MAEFIDTPEQMTRRKANQKIEATEGGDPFANFGKVVPMWRRQAAEEHCKDMGLTDTLKRTTVIDGMCEAIRRDEPYAAMDAGMTYLDLTGTYRLMAVLLTASKPKNWREPKTFDKTHPDYTG